MLANPAQVGAFESIIMHTRNPLHWPSLLVAVALTLVGAGSLIRDALAHEYKAGALVIGHPWARATLPGAKVGGGYLSITNNGSVPDRLTGFSSSIADRGEMHEMSTSGGVMRMREIKGLEIKPGETVAFKPGGNHLMFMDIKEPLVEGKPVKVTLTFERAGAVEVEFVVDKAGASGGKTGGHEHHDRSTPTKN